MWYWLGLHTWMHSAVGWAALGAPGRFCSHARGLWYSVWSLSFSLSLSLQCVFPSIPNTPTASRPLHEVSLSLSSRIAGLLYSMVAGFQEWKLQLPGPLKARRRTGRVLLSVGWGKSHGQPRFKGRGNKLYLWMGGVICTYSEGRSCWLPSLETIINSKHTIWAAYGE